MNKFFLRQHKIDLQMVELWQEYPINADGRTNKELVSFLHFSTFWGVEDFEDKLMRGEDVYFKMVEMETVK